MYGRMLAKASVTESQSLSGKVFFIFLHYVNFIPKQKNETERKERNERERKQGGKEGRKEEREGGRMEERRKGGKEK